MSDINEKFEQARIPYVYQSKQLDQPGIKSYIAQSSFVDDRKAGIGVVVCGPASARTKVFPVVARAAVCMNDRVLYCTLGYLLNVVTQDNHSDFDGFRKIKSLYVANFYDDSQPSPLSGMERMRVEDFLRLRYESGLRNNYAVAATGFLAANWWSDNFLHGQSEYLRSFQCQ